MPRPEHIQSNKGDATKDWYITPELLQKLNWDLLILPYLLFPAICYLVPSFSRWVIPKFLKFTPNLAYEGLNFGDFFSVGVSLLGMYIRTWAFDTLGQFFTYSVTIREGHQLVKDGPYKWLVHPSYTGLWLGAAGLFFFVGFRSIRFWALLYIPSMAYIMAPRIINEERALANEFGQDFHDFLASRWRFIPYVF